MSTGTEEIIRICEALPEGKRDEVADFARFLLARQDDDKWEALLAQETPRPRLESFLREALAEKASPLNPKDL